MNLDNVILIVFITISLLLVTTAILRRESNFSKMGNDFLRSNDSLDTKNYQLERIERNLNHNNPVGESTNVTFNKLIERIRNRYYFAIKNFHNKTINFTYDIYQNKSSLCGEINNKTNCSINLNHIKKDITLYQNDSALVVLEYTFMPKDINSETFQVYVCNKEKVSTYCHPNLIDKIYGKTDFTINII
ncbi:MAG: hypothetical protein ACOCRX_02155 [Candidatus Woesearchaeota archaeon]